uniref:Pre-C2HC domain-containing protein n=1 Tax=Lutzomyia longipalpis TaxID=7200 RepID=A0A1B0EZR7_LUTLO
MANNNEPATMDMDDADNSRWQTIAGKRKAQSPPRETMAKKQTTITDFLPPAQPVTTENRYSSLTEEVNENNSGNNDNNEDETSNVDNPRQEPATRPPPIVVYDVTSISDLTTFLNDYAPNGYTMKTLSRNQIKIQTKTAVAYREVLGKLKEKNIQLHSYQCKDEKSFRVVLRNMHFTMDVKEIKDALLEKGHVVRDIRNMKHGKTKAPLPMFFINLAPASNNKDIYAIDSILHMKVIFEAPRPRREIPQCSRCQSFNHTKKYCNRAPRCVKCIESHLSKECPRKQRDEESPANAVEEMFTTFSATFPPSFDPFVDPEGPVCTSARASSAYSPRSLFCTTRADFDQSPANAVQGMLTTFSATFPPSFDPFVDPEGPACTSE